MKQEQGPQQIKKTEAVRLCISEIEEREKERREGHAP